MSLSFQELGLLGHLKILAEVSILLIHILRTGRGSGPAQLLTQAFPILQPTGHLRLHRAVYSLTGCLPVDSKHFPPPHPPPFCPQARVRTAGKEDQLLRSHVILPRPPDFQNLTELLL